MREICFIRRVRAAAWLCAVGGVMLCAAACHTVEGAGKDIEGLGNAIQDAADGD